MSDFNLYLLADFALALSTGAAIACFFGAQNAQARAVICWLAVLVGCGVVMSFRVRMQREAISWFMLFQSVSDGLFGLAWILPLAAMQCLVAYAGAKIALGIMPAAMLGVCMGRLRGLRALALVLAASSCICSLQYGLWIRLGEAGR